jgi:hypothetical protein
MSYQNKIIYEYGGEIKYYLDGDNSRTYMLRDLELLQIKMQNQYRVDKDDLMWYNEFQQKCEVING